MKRHRNCNPLLNSISGSTMGSSLAQLNHLIISSSSTMGSRTLMFLKTSFSNTKNTLGKAKTQSGSRAQKYSTRSALQPPDVPRLAETARISLTPNEVEEFGPKIQQVIEWFGQLQAVDLDSVEPSIRADTEGDNLRDDVPEIFENREAMIVAVPSFEEPYIKVPKVLNKE